MKILIASDKFKGSLTAAGACIAIKRGVERYDPSIEVELHPLADGGEGSLEILDSHLNLESVRINVSDPLFRPIQTLYKIKNGISFIEMATASGLGLLGQEERNCMFTTSYGTGEMIRHAIERGVKSIYLFIGGSATNDAGMGMAAALGYRFLDVNGEQVRPIGENLIKVASIDADALAADVNGVEVTVVTDVDNVLFGPKGAAHIYASQKGASREDVACLDKGLRHFSSIIKRDLGMDISPMPGAGAAGGMGGGAVAFLGANIQSGVGTIMQVTDFDNRINKADLVITGEGKLDQQTLHGKVVQGVSDTCKRQGIPMAIACGTSELTAAELQQLTAIGCTQLVSGDVAADEAIKHAAPLLEQRIFEMMPALKAKLP